MNRIAIWLTATMLSAAGAGAQTLEPDRADVPGRYQMQAIEGGLTRLDTATGAVSLCRTEGGELVCEESREQRRLFEQEIAALTARIEALEERLGESGEGGPPLAEDEEFDRALGQMRRFFFAFRDIMRELEGEPEEAPNAPALPPSRT